MMADGRMGKFGWKADVPTLVEFMGDAFRNEMGVTNPLQRQDEMSGCGANRPDYANGGARKRPPFRGFVN